MQIKSRDISGVKVALIENWRGVEEETAAFAQSQAELRELLAGTMAIVSEAESLGDALEPLAEWMHIGLQRIGTTGNPSELTLRVQVMRCRLLADLVGMLGKATSFETWPAQRNEACGRFHEAGSSLLESASAFFSTALAAARDGSATLEKDDLGKWQHA